MTSAGVVISVKLGFSHGNCSAAAGVRSAPRTMEVFADLGVLDKILASGDLGTVMRAYQGDEVVWEGQMAEPTDPTPAVPYPNIWFVPQFRTEEILREQLGAKVELGTELIDFTQDADGVTATLGTGETVRARYLVAADGGRSTVRKQLGIAFPGETDEATTMLFADARVDGITHDHGRMWQVGDGGVAVMPLAGTELFVVVAKPQENTDEPIRDYLQRQVTDASGRDDILVREVTWHTTWRANTRLAERFREGRVFLAGDAGHVHPPTGGQGMNTGIQDGYNLGWKLAATLAGGPLSRDDRAEPSAITAGDRAPDAPATMADGKPVRLFDLFRGPHWTLLTFGVAAPELDDSYTVVRPGDPANQHAIVDTDGHVHANYDVADGTLVLVRPDGYIGLVTSDTERLAEYRAQMFALT